MTATGEFMDMAQRADRRALFAALQRALICLGDQIHGDEGFETHQKQLAYIRIGLEIGAELGSPEQLEAGR